MAEEKYCADCVYHLQCDGYYFKDPRYHKCKYREMHGFEKRDIVSGQFPMVTCKDMRNDPTKCGQDANWYKKA